MKKNLLFIGILFLGLSIIIGSLVLSNSLSEFAHVNSIINGSLSVTDSNSYRVESDVLQSFDAGVMLGYDVDAFIQDIEKGKLEGIPYTEVGGNYIFSKKALEEWIYNKTIN